MSDRVNHMGLALCTGCGIGESVDTGRILDAARTMMPGLTCIRHRALCSEDGVGTLLAAAREDGISRIALAACSPRVKTDRFLLGGVEVERINLREQLSWVMEKGSEDTQMCAEDQVRMGLAGLSGRTSTVPYIPESLSRAILVLGGGVSGMSAALEGADAGYQVYLVEQEKELGGRMRGMADAPSRSGQQLEEKTATHPGITVYTSTTVVSVEGEPGHFLVELNGGPVKTITAGAIVFATGWDPYDPGRLASLGYGMQGVRTLEEFELQLSDGRIPRSILFILCAGSRDQDHLAYCSSYCCSAALRQVLMAREKNPDATIYVVYRDIRTPGFQEELYRQVQEDDSVFFTKGHVEQVVHYGKGIRTKITGTLMGREVTLQTEMVVLVTGMVPRNSESLGLKYRQGKGLPELAFGFPDSHFTCFPYETRRTGIYAAGTARAPMDMESSMEDAAGAMMKAIQCVESTGRGEAVHPRTGDTTFPGLYMERCTDCKRCTEECPFGSYDENEKGTPLPHPSRCRRCGICLGSCPERVIGFSDFSINLVSSMIKAVHVPDEFEEKPRVLVFLCENDAYPALDAAGTARLMHSPFIRVIPVRCIGAVNRVWISDALSHGFDGILQIGCEPGDETQCHYIHGSRLSEERASNFQETLETMMLEPERVRTQFVEISGSGEITSIINDYLEELETLGPNPFKSI